MNEDGRYRNLQTKLNPRDSTKNKTQLDTVISSSPNKIINIAPFPHKTPRVRSQKKKVNLLKLNDSTRAAWPQLPLPTPLIPPLHGHAITTVKKYYDISKKQLLSTQTVGETPRQQSDKRGVDTYLYDVINLFFCFSFLLNFFGLMNLKLL